MSAARPWDAYGPGREASGTDDGGARPAPRTRCAAQVVDKAIRDPRRLKSLRKPREFIGQDLSGVTDTVNSRESPRQRELKGMAMAKKNAALIGETAEVLLTAIKESVETAHDQAKRKGGYLPATFLHEAAQAFALVVEHDQHTGSGRGLVA